MRNNHHNASPRQKRSFNFWWNFLSDEKVFLENSSPKRNFVKCSLPGNWLVMGSSLDSFLSSFSHGCAKEDSRDKGPHNFCKQNRWFSKQLEFTSSGNLQLNFIKLIEFIWDNWNFLKINYSRSKRARLRFNIDENITSSPWWAENKTEILRKLKEVFLEIFIIECKSTVSRRSEELNKCCFKRRKTHAEWDFGRIVVNFPVFLWKLFQHVLSFFAKLAAYRLLSDLLQLNIFIHFFSF